jgi:hypothetical protein
VHEVHEPITAPNGWVEARNEAKSLDTHILGADNTYKSNRSIMLDLTILPHAQHVKWYPEAHAWGIGCLFVPDKKMQRAAQHTSTC